MLCSSSSDLGVPEDYFDEWIAERCERLWPDIFAPAVVAPAVEVLAEMAGDDAALELGIGTGRLALPLSRQGVRVSGIDLSPAMVAQLRAQRGAEAIHVKLGDLATTSVDGAFRVVYMVRNTIMNLTTQDAQVEAFANAAAHLERGGFFVVEVLVPPWQRLTPGETFLAFEVSPTHIGVDEIEVVYPELPVAPLLVHRRRGEEVFAAVPVRLAGGTRPHGAPRRDDAAPAME